jgi:hypothetical protein
MREQSASPCIPASVGLGAQRIDDVLLGRAIGKAEAVAPQEVRANLNLLATMIALMQRQGDLTCPMRKKSKSDVQR